MDNIPYAQIPSEYSKLKLKHRVIEVVAPIIVIPVMYWIAVTIASL